MADRPILFSGPMVRAILREIAAPGTGKTQTRRVLKPQPLPFIGEFFCVGHEKKTGRRVFNARGDTGHVQAVVPGPPNCFSATLVVPYGVGDRLWVRETWAVSTIYDGMPPRDIQPCGVRYAATDQRLGIKDRPSMFMPRWASRLTLTVTDVRVERLQDISEADARAEGVVKVRDGCHVIRGFDYDLSELCHTHAVTPFAKLWEHINGARAGCSWDANPWVVVVSFRPALTNIDAAHSAAANIEAV